MLDQRQGLTQDISPESTDESLYQEEWVVKLNTGGEYTLGKEQAWAIQQAIGNGNRGIIMFETFSISLPYVAEFYRTKRYLKDAIQLPARASEKPMSKEDFEKVRQRIKEIRERFSL